MHLTLTRYPRIQWLMWSTLVCRTKTLTAQHMVVLMGWTVSAPTAAAVSHLPPGIEHARTYARLGLRAIWLHPPSDSTVGEQQRGKKPLDNGWQAGQWTHPDEIAPPRVVGANIGLVTGLVPGAPPGRAVVVVDADDAEADAWVRANLPPSPWVVATRKGHHYYYRRPDVPELRRFKVVLKPDPAGQDTGLIDIQADGGQVVAPPSIHRTGHVYAANGRWSVTDFEHMPVFQEAWFADVRKARRAPQQAQAIGVGSRNNSLTSLAGRLRRAGASEAAILLELQAVNARMPAPLDDVEVQTIAHSVSRYDPAGWVERLHRNDKGRIKPSLHNTAEILANDLRWDQVIRWDRFSQELVFCGAPPFDGIGTDAGDVDGAVRAVRDVDLARMRHWLAAQAEYDGVEPTRETIYDAARMVAQLNAFHQVAEYLTCLPAWDGVPRVDAWLTRYAGVEASEYAARVGRWWLLGAVARAMTPGCKVDTVLILEGPQGKKKSTLIAALVPKPDWFLDSELELGTQQAMDRLRGKWIAELSELASMKRGDMNRTKAFLSSRSDTFRVAYDRLSSDFPRTCVFMGSINPEGPYINDLTGARRFWPVVCSGVIDVDAVVRDRDQIWAEAYALWRAGEKWWAATDDEAQCLAAEQAQRVMGDTWEERIASYCDGKDSVAMHGLLESLGVETRHQTRADQMRCAAILSTLGWVRKRRAGQWMYVKT